MSRPRWRGSKPAQRARLRRVQANRCGICSRELSGTVEVDHMLPRSVGGPDTWHNLHLVHRYCNHRKGVSSLASARAQIAAQFTLFDENPQLMLSEASQLVLFDEASLAHPSLDRDRPAIAA